MSKASVYAGKSLLNPSDHTLVLIDHQSQMAFGVRSIDLVELRNNVGMVAKAAKTFNVSTILTTVSAKSFSGPIFQEILEVYPEAKQLDRTTMNCWEDQNVINEINRLGKNRIVMGGLWTSVCISGPVLSAIEQGFEVYFITDACGDVTDEAHQMAVQRMIQAGARPITSLAYLLELQRDWGRAETYDAVLDIAKVNGGTYGIGIGYAYSMFHAQEGH